MNALAAYSGLPVFERTAWMVERAMLVLLTDPLSARKALREAPLVGGCPAF
jgi:hypothetical protein